MSDSHSAGTSTQLPRPPRSLPAPHLPHPRPRATAGNRLVPPPRSGIHFFRADLLVKGQRSSRLLTGSACSCFAFQL